MTIVRDFKDLNIWQQGIEIVKSIYSITGSFPKSEQFGLTNQMRRASVSIPSNIAEGKIKKQSKEFSRFLGIALGSAAELETQVIIAKELDFLNSEQSVHLIDIIHSEIKQINALKKRLADG